MTVLLVFAASKLNAQDFNEEFRRRLRQEMIQPEIRPLPQQQQPTFNRPLPQQQPQQEMLRVSPTTVLPTKYDRIQTLYQPEQFRVNLNLNYTNEDRSAVARSRIDYATGKYNPIPDSRSTAQRAQFSGFSGLGGGGIVGSGGKMQNLDIYYDENSPEWVQRVGRRLNNAGTVDTLDPVRAINNRRARRRAARLDTILREFEVNTLVGRGEPVENEEEEEEN
ncbi:MAG: hypothetical protein LBI15_11715 [Dysgonamonadaceae bacterium]|nr:hypothetical protein [Dysgonamonadaceae bacterium]